MPEYEGLKISDDILWGKLVAAWATGDGSFLGAGATAPPLPRDMAEFNAQCAAIGLEVKFPGATKGISFVTHTPDTVVIKLPPKKMVEEETIRLSQPGAKYPVPQFYDDFYAKLLVVPANKMKDFQVARYGDYAIHYCG